jgi:hypothetical protein
MSFLKIGGMSAAGGLGILGLLFLLSSQVAPAASPVFLFLLMVFVLAGAVALVLAAAAKMGGG